MYNFLFRPRKLNLFLWFCLIVGLLAAKANTAHAIDHRDGPGEWETCPAPNFCQITNADVTINAQDNHLHNALQGMHGPAQKLYNIYEVTPENTTATPPVPEVYKAYSPGNPQY